MVFCQMELTKGDESFPAISSETFKRLAMFRLEVIANPQYL